MKKIISVALVACMLLTSVCLLASCGGTGEPGVPNVNGAIVDFDLTGCKVYFDAAMSISAQQKANGVIDALRELSTVSVRGQKVTNDGEEYTLDEPAILIGDTGYRESNSVINGLGEYGWAISVQGNKLVIAGSNSFFTRVAIAYFTTHYLNEDCVKGATLSLNKSVDLKNIGKKAVVENDESEYAIVYSHLTDGVNNPGYGSKDPETQGGPATDYIFDVSTDIRTLMANAADVMKGTFAQKTDLDAAADYEVLIGNMDRAEYKEELNKLTVNEYGVLIKNGKAMLLAWNDVALKGAHDLFKDLIAACTEEDDEGNSTLYFPTDFSVTEELADGWAIDFPKPEATNLYLDGTVDVGDNSIEYIYAGTGANEENYLSYCETLEDAGYELIDENNKPLNTQNIFRYYVNEETGSTLYVYYSPCFYVWRCLSLPLLARAIHKTYPQRRGLTTTSFF